MVWKYRKKLDNIIIEEDRKYKMTLPKDAKVTFDALNMLRLNENTSSASKPTGQTEENNTQRFEQSILNELPKSDASEEELRKEAQKHADKLMREILG